MLRPRRANTFQMFYGLERLGFSRHRRWAVLLIALGLIDFGSQRSAQQSISSIERRRSHEILVYAHDFTGTFYCLPEWCRHFQNFIGRPSLRNPCANLNVLLRGQQVQVQHFVNRLHWGSTGCVLHRPQKRVLKRQWRYMQPQRKRSRRILQAQHCFGHTPTELTSAVRLPGMTWLVHHCQQNTHTVFS